jgi:hypothetical protein
MDPSLRTRAPIALVAGNLKVFVNDTSKLGDVLNTLHHSQKTSHDELLAELAIGASRILEAVSAHSDGRRVRNLHQVRALFRTSLSAKVSKDLETVNKVYSFLRHMNSAATKHMVDGIIEELGAASISSLSSETGPDTGIVDEGVGDEHGSVDDSGGTLDVPDGEESDESSSDDSSDIASSSSEGCDCDSLSVAAGQDQHDSAPDVLRTSVRELRDRRMHSDARKLLLDAFAERLAAAPKYRDNCAKISWDELKESGFVRGPLYEDVCDVFHDGAKDPRDKSELFLALYSELENIWAG